MARIQIKDLPALSEMTADELQGLYGGWKIKSLGKFQQKVVAGAAGGATAGATFGSWAGPAGSILGAAGGAVSGAASTIVGNHAEKRWSGGGLQNWRNPSRW